MSFTVLQKLIKFDEKKPLDQFPFTGMPTVFSKVDVFKVGKLSERLSLFSYYIMDTRLQIKQLKNTCEECT